MLVPGSGNKPTAAESANGYNRFGFKLRKNEAINMISKKQTNAVDKRFVLKKIYLYVM